MNNKSENSSFENNQQRQKQIEAYLYGEMTPDESAEFETALKNNENLRIEFEQCREAFKTIRGWVDDEVPGIQKVELLEIPSRESLKTVENKYKKYHIFGNWLISLFPQRFRKYAFQGITIALFFIIGFLFGFVSSHKMRSEVPNDKITSSLESIKPEITPPNLDEQETIKKSPIPEKPQKKDGVDVAKNIPPKFETKIKQSGVSWYDSDSKGRITFETTLKGSKTQVLWVVDGNLKINSSSIKQ